MADPMRIRAQAAGDKATVRVLWFIQEVTATHNGKPVPSAQWGPSVSKNPFMQFNVKGAKAGDKIAVTWTDNKNDKRTDEATVS